MAYSKTTWVNGGPPAISAENLNKIENGIGANADHLDQLPLQIRSGTIPSTSVSAGSYADVPVTFNNPMAGKPKVVIGLLSASTSPELGLFSVAALSESATGFTCRFFNGNSSGYRLPEARWVAIYGGLS